MRRTIEGMDLFRGTSITDPRIGEEFNGLIEADRWLIAWRLADRAQGVYDAMCNAAKERHTSADEQSTLVVFCDNSVLAMEAETETYADLADYATLRSAGATNEEAWEDAHRDYPTLRP